MRIGKALVEALTIIASELVATAVFVVAAAPWLFPRDVKAVGLAAALAATFTSPFYWLLLVATVAGVVGLFRRRVSDK
ncbi:MAG: hypothetical protein WCA27_27540 [Candidatus Sulfotelmatobacter sp.]